MSILSQFTPPNTSAFPSDLGDTLSIPPIWEPPVLSTEDWPDASFIPWIPTFLVSTDVHSPEDLSLLATTESPEPSTAAPNTTATKHHYWGKHVHLSLPAPQENSAVLWGWT